MKMLRILLATLLLYNALLFSGVFSKRACQNRVMKLSCRRGKQISIRSAFYGRRSWRICPNGPKKTTRCSARKVLKKLRRSCNDKRTCRISASNYLFGNPCRGTFKYLEVKFKCVKSGITSPPPPSACTRYPCLIFQDNFDTLNMSVWEHEITANGGGNWEFEYYINNRTNSYARNGTLFIKPTLTADRFGRATVESGNINLWGTQPADVCTGNQFYGCLRPGPGAPANQIVPPIQSARLRSVQSFNFKYGKIEFRAKMPAGDWIWPALWLLPTRQEYGLWPASGEIDIAEVRGNTNLTLNGVPIGTQRVAQTLHWGPFWPVDPWGLTHVTRDTTSGTYATAFHTFGATWSNNQFNFTVDGVVTKTIAPPNGFWKLGNFDVTIPGTQNPWQQPGSNKMAPFDKEFYIIMNVAVGGLGFFPDNAVNHNGKKPWLNTSPQAAKDFWDGRAQWLPTWNVGKNNGEGAAMKVDYVRVWKLQADP